MQTGDDMAAKAALVAQWEEEQAQRPVYYEERPETVASKKFKDAVAKRVRSESKKLHPPIRTDQLEDLARDVPPEEIGWRLIELQNDDGDAYADVLPAYTFTGATYLFSDRYLSHEAALALARAPELKAAVLRVVRENAKEAANPTGAYLLLRLAGGITQDELDAVMQDIADDEAAADIRSVTAFSGVVYYYSSEHMSEERAIAQARAEELQVKMLVEVRADSKYLVKLTNTKALEDLAPDVQPGEIDRLLEDIQGVPHYADICVLTAKTGERFAYSSQYMTEEYATVLLRAESHDPAYIIAETVREASEIYPRATGIELFKYPTFGVDRHELDATVARVLETYDDIKKVENTGDDVFLYSDRFMSAGAAEGSAKSQIHGDG